jgi:hypothetical protein
MLGLLGLCPPCERLAARPYLVAHVQRTRAAGLEAVCVCGHGTAPALFEHTALLRQDEHEIEGDAQTVADR